MLTADMSLFEVSLGANSNAVGVIKQGGRIVHAARRTLSPEEVYDAGVVGYRYSCPFRL